MKSDRTTRGILFVDDEPSVLESLRRVVETHYPATFAKSAKEAIEAFEQQGPFAMVISDFRMPNLNGAELLLEIRNRDPDVVTMLFTGAAGFDDYKQIVLLTQLIFAVAGGLKYVASGVHMAVEWATDSKADSLIEKHLLFTKETQHGRSIFTDRLMEWVNHDLRKFCGKTWYPGKEEKIIRTALLLREKVKVRERAAFCVAERGEAERQTYLLGASKPRATDCFVSGLYWFLNRLIWKLGSGLRYSSDALVDKSELRSFSDRSTLNPQCVNMLTVAAEGLTNAALTYDYEPEARKSAATYASTSLRVASS